MDDLKTLAQLYEELAHAFGHGQIKCAASPDASPLLPSVSEIECLVLAADAAFRAGLLADAERLRSLVVVKAPQHLVTRFASMMEAMQSPEMRVYVEQVREQWPRARVSELKLTLNYPRDLEFDIRDGVVAQVMSKKKPKSSDEQDIFETEFEVPALDESSDAIVADSDPESSDFALALDDSELVLEEDAAVGLDEQEAEASAEDTNSEAVVEEESVDFADLDADVQVEDDAIVNQESKKPGYQRKRAATTALNCLNKRRVTVRYFNRMNPERAHPMLVIFSKQIVEKILKKGTSQQTTAPINVDLEKPVEIEPLLPGCTCYPPKIAARLDKKDDAFTFYIVPNVLGTIEGAKIEIRQEGKALTEIALDVTVVKQTWVMVCAVATLVLPFVSALCKHYRVDLKSQLEDGFDFYIAILYFLLAYLSPIAIFLGLLSLTLVIYWLCRARERDVFNDIETISPKEKLRQIAVTARENPAEAADELWLFRF